VEAGEATLSDASEIKTNATTENGLRTINSAETGILNGQMFGWLY